MHDSIISVERRENTADESFSHEGLLWFPSNGRKPKQELHSAFALLKVLRRAGGWKYDLGFAGDDGRASIFFPAVLHTLRRI